MSNFREQYASDVREILWANQAHIKFSTDHSAYTNGFAVNAPIAGAAPLVAIDSTVPAAGFTASQRSDSYARYTLSSFRAMPVTIPNVEEMQINYDKRISVMSGSINAVSDVSSKKIFNSWVSGAPTASFLGSATASGNAPVGATGARKKVTLADLKALSLRFKADKISTQMYVALTDTMIFELMEDSTISEAQKLGLQQSVIIDGKLPKLFGMNIVAVHELPVFNSSGTVIRDVAGDGSFSSVASTDVYGIVAWTPPAVAAAIGNIQTYENVNDAQYFGSVMSAEIFAGGAAIDNKGVYVTLQL